jgi:hypothetical protein
MRISDEVLDEFIDIYKEEFGEDISRDEASEMATLILTLYTLLSKKPPGLDEKAAPVGSAATQHGDCRAQVVHRT